MSAPPILAAALGEVLPPLAVLVAAVVVIVVTLRADGRARPAAARPAPDDALARWQVAHGPVVDEWLQAHDERFVGIETSEHGPLEDGDRPSDPPDPPDPLGPIEPVDRTLEQAFDDAVAACPDEELAEHLRDTQALAQGTLVATVAGHDAIAHRQHLEHLEHRAAAVERLEQLGHGRAEG